MAEEKSKTGSAAVAEQEIIESKQIEDIRAEVRMQLTKEIEGMTLGQFREAFGELYAKIANDVCDQSREKDIEKVPGFLLEAEDPFGRAAERVFVQNAGVGMRIIVRKLEESRLPMVLPFKDKATKTALESYLLRAEGAGDIERVRRAKVAIRKCK